MTSAVRQRFPAGPTVEAGDLVRELNCLPPDGPLTVGDERMIDFLSTLSRTLLRPTLTHRHPELASLGFFLRRSASRRAIDGLGDPGDSLRRPRGLVFQVPPSNVDTVFVYSWALAALAGNNNVVRVSSRSSVTTEALLDALNAALVEAHPAIGRTQRVVAYDRDDAVTGAFSAACDLRVIWGGDSTVDALRRLRIPPHARDLTFPDRSSLAVISASAWLVSDPATRDAAALGFYNDAYWFDQAACSSPRAVCWVGDSDEVAAARSSFYDGLFKIVVQKAPSVDAAMAVEKRVAAYGLAVDGVATHIQFRDRALTTVDLASPQVLPRRWLGVGTFPETAVARLTDLAAIVVPRDQTITQFGFTAEELIAFTHAIRGQGVDRIVPIGCALDFSAVWDGYDLIREFTRLTTVMVPR